MRTIDPALFVEWFAIAPRATPRAAARGISAPMKATIELPPEFTDALRRLEERVADVERQLDEARTAAAVPRPTKVFMRVREFAERRGISASTVSSLIAEGMPCEGKGRLRRIPVELAELWLLRREGRRPGFLGLAVP